MGDRIPFVSRLGWRLLSLVVICVLPAACARPVGDLGRADPSVLHDVVMPTIGTFRARNAGEPVSGFNQSDEEVAMADHIWRFLVSSHARDWFYDTAAELQRTRLTPANAIKFSPDRYYDWLHGTKYQSAPVRYATVKSDILADTDTLPATFTAICAVKKMDRRRVFAARHLVGVGRTDLTDLAARRAENIAQIAMFVHALRYRYESYDYALNHLLIETPYPDAVGVDGNLTSLAADLHRAESGDFCGPTGIATDRPFMGRDREIPSRFSRPRALAPDPDLPSHAS